MKRRRWTGRRRRRWGGGDEWCKEMNGEQEMKGGGGDESARLRWVRRKRRGSVSPSTAMFTWRIVVSAIPLCLCS